MVTLLKRESAHDDLPNCTKYKFSKQRQIDCSVWQKFLAQVLSNLKKKHPKVVCRRLPLLLVVGRVVWKSTSAWDTYFDCSTKSFDFRLIWLIFFRVFFNLQWNRPPKYIIHCFFFKYKSVHIIFCDVYNSIYQNNYI